jgi:cell shape-determining protein MreC
MKVFVKRFFPFLLTFAAGLLVASFFVTVAAPSFQFNKREGKYKKFRYLKNENQRLRRENQRLKRQLAQREALNSDFELNFDVPPPPPLPPMPPPPPAAARR